MEVEINRNGATTQEIPKTTGGNELENDYVTKCIGSFGVWQARVCFIACLTRLISMWNLLSIIFVASTTDFVCNDFKSNTTEEIKDCSENCTEYTYSPTVFDSTLISTFDLVCESAWLVSFTQTFMMFGVLLGTSFYGWISDRFGRRNGLRLCTFLNIIFMVAAPYSPNYISFCCLRFLIGISCGGIFAISAVYTLEIVGSRHREAAGCLIILPDGLAEATLPIYAYFSSTWNMFLFEYCAVSVLIFLLVLTLPESPRWLMSNGQTDKAIYVIKCAACRNKLNDINIQDVLMGSAEDIKAKQEKVQKLSYSYIDLFSTKDLALRTSCMFMVFFAAGGLYFGISQYVSYIGFNIYLDVAFLGIIQVPLSCLSILLNKCVGRKTSIMVTFVATGVSLILLIFFPVGHWMCTVLGLIGMSAISISFAVIYIYISELFPTPLRNMAFGIISSGGKVGAMLTPFITVITPHWIPSIILGSWPFIASVVCILLPETKGKNLIDIVN